MSNLLYLAFLVVSLVSNAPSYLLSKEITKLGVLQINSTSADELSGVQMVEPLYIKTTRKFFQAKLLQHILSVIIIIEHPFFFTVFFALNVLLAIRFNQFIRKKAHVMRMSCKSKSEHSTQAAAAVVVVVSSFSSSMRRTPRRTTTVDKKFNFTLMTLSLCLIYVIGNFIDSFDMILDAYLYDVDGVLVNVGNILFMGTQSIKFFVYLKFNLNFRREFWKRFSF
jgi:hypothetical protein